MMKTETLSLEQARQIVLHAQMLNDETELSGGKEGIAQIIEKLGYVQIDTISVINRSHHHTLWTRFPDYSEEMLHDLQAADRRIFEYWGHAISYLPMSDYRYYQPRMKNFVNPDNKWIAERLKTCHDIMQPVLERIRKEGPLSSKDFEAPPGQKADPWWGWKPAKAALEFLFWQGELMVSERRNFHKLYDLTERVLPNTIDLTPPEADELGRFYVSRALSAYGLAREREIRAFLQPDAARDNHFRSVNWETMQTALQQLIASGEVQAIEVNGIANETYYTFTGTLENVHLSNNIRTDIHLLSPFDNLIIQRERIKKLFGFDYMLECYVPAAKRQYGYFVLPILWMENLIGRFDPKADRKKKTLIIRNLQFEPDFDSLTDFIPVFSDKLVELARFNRCDSIVFENISPAELKTPLVRAVKRQI